MTASTLAPVSDASAKAHASAATDPGDPSTPTTIRFMPSSSAMGMAAGRAGRPYSFGPNVGGWRRLARAHRPANITRKASLLSTRRRTVRDALLLRKGDGERDPDHVPFERATCAEPRVAKHAEHALVAGKRLGDETGEPAGACGVGEPLQQQRTEAVVLVGVGDDEGHLRLALALPVVPPDADELAVELEHQRHPAVVVDVGEPVDLGGCQVRVGVEEVQVLALRGQAVMEGDQAGPVVGADRAHAYRPDARGDIAFELRGVLPGAHACGARVIG